MLTGAAQEIVIACWYDVRSGRVLTLRAKIWIRTALFIAAIAAGDFLLTAARTLGPTGVTFDVFTNDKVKVQVTGTQDAGDRTISITLGGTW